MLRAEVITLQSLAIVSVGCKVERITYIHVSKVNQKQLCESSLIKGLVFFVYLDLPLNSVRDMLGTT